MSRNGCGVRLRFDLRGRACTVFTTRNGYLVMAYTDADLLKIVVTGGKTLSERNTLKDGRKGVFCSMTMPPNIGPCENVQ